ncbi:MAG: hypothetical protein J6K21_01435 [Bacilli bacterium]|nr:hypothetical protein [Bacilli bacterium]
MNKIIEFLKNLFLKIFNFLKKFFKKTYKNIYYNIKKFKYKNKNAKNFFIQIFSYLGSAVTSLVKKDKKEKEVNISYELKKINKNILNIENSIENETTPIVLKMYKREINKKINKLKNIKNLKSREESKLIKDQTDALLNIKDKITVCENKLKGIDYNNLKNNKNNIELSKKKNISNNKNITKQKNINKPKIKKINFNLIKDKLKKSVTILTIPVVGAVKKIKKQENSIKNTNVKEEKTIINNVKKLNKEINNVYLDISKIRNNNYSENKENELLELKEKVEKLKKEYLKLSNEKKFNNLKMYKDINNIDPNHLVYHDRSLEDLIEYLEKSIKEIKNNKNIKQEEKITNEKIIKKEEEKRKNEVLIDKNQIELIRNSVKKDILLSRKEIENIKEDMKKLNGNYKPTLLNKLTNFFRVSINIGISLIPFGIFKNKLLATLTSGIILNNRIRSMNSIFNNEEIDIVQYEDIINNINDKKSCLKSTNYILLDTIDEIDKLKSKLELLYFDNESQKLLINLEEMKLDLLEENVKIETMLEETDKLQINKIKKKVH